MLNLCGIVVAILKMATGSTFSMSAINSGHHYLPTHQILMISDNVEYLRYCGGHFNQRLPGACNRSPGSKLLSITTQLHCGGHRGGRVQLPDTILEEDHPMTISSKFGFN
jgi:hypothetical protein